MALLSWSGTHNVVAPPSTPSAGKRPAAPARRAARRHGKSQTPRRSGPTHVARRRSADWAHPRLVRGAARRRAARVSRGPPGRLVYRPQRVRPLHPRVQHRALDDPRLLQQEHAAVPDARPHPGPQRDGPRPGIIPLDGRPLPTSSRGPASRRALGRRHAGGRDHALQEQAATRVGPRTPTSSSGSRGSTRTRCSTTSRSATLPRGRRRGPPRPRCSGTPGRCSSTRATRETPPCRTSWAVRVGRSGAGRAGRIDGARSAKGSHLRCSASRRSRCARTGQLAARKTIQVPLGYEDFYRECTTVPGRPSLARWRAPMTSKLTATIEREGDGYVAPCQKWMSSVRETPSLRRGITSRVFG